MPEGKINFNIDDGDDFFAHEVTINFNPTQFVMDFKSITPRSDPRVQQGPQIRLKHNVVLLDAYHAKKFHELMETVLQRYEKEFGKIDKPASIKAAEKKSMSRAKKKDKSTVPSYFG